MTTRSLTVRGTSIGLSASGMRQTATQTRPGAPPASATTGSPSSHALMRVGLMENRPGVASCSVTV